MRKSFLFCFVALSATTLLSAQDQRRRATLGRGPGGGEGCVIDVVVDGAADVEIRGDDAILRNLQGQPPQFRQFECSRPMPPDAPGFRFSEVDGRGRMELIRTPRAGSPLVVRIDDPQGGAGEYRFEITWFGARGNQGFRLEQGDRGYVPNSDTDRDHRNFDTNRDQFFQGERWRQGLFQRVREDVDHLQHSTFPFTGDQSRLARTIFELNDLQTKLTQGRYDDHELNDVMYSLSNVLQYNRISARDREILSDDLRRLREFRDHHDDYGAREGGRP